MKARIFKIKTHKFLMKMKNKFLKETLPDGKNHKNRRRLSKIVTEMERTGKLLFSNKFKEVKINDHFILFSIILIQNSIRDI